MKVWIVGDQYDGTIYGVFLTSWAAESYAEKSVPDEEKASWELTRFVEGHDVQ